MGRKPTRNANLPSGMRARHRKSKTYYYLDSGAKPRIETPLGSDFVLAVGKWAELTASERPANGVITFRYAAERYIRDVLPTKAPATQKDNLRELGWLYRFFDDPPAPLDTIEPINIRQYMDWRIQQAKKDAIEKAKKRNKPIPELDPMFGHVRANREKALFSHIWNYSRAKGLTNKPNPCAGIKGNKEEGRTIYVRDIVVQAVWEAAEPPLQDAMDLAYLVSQRPADTLKFRKDKIIDGALEVQQAKTKKKIRFKVEGEFATFIQRVNSRPVTSLYLISNAKGAPLTKYMLRGAFDRARIAAIKAHPELADEIREFQFRDLRAKAGTDTEEVRGMDAAQDQLGHTTRKMTQHYVRHRRGKLVNPTK
jgi:integrase